MNKFSLLVCFAGLIAAGCSDPIRIEEEDRHPFVEPNLTHSLTPEESGLEIPFRGYGLSDEAFAEVIRTVSRKYEGSDFLVRADEFAPSSPQIRAGVSTPQREAGKFPAGNTASWYNTTDDSDFWVYSWQMLYDEEVDGNRLTVACYIHRYEDSSGAACENAGCIASYTFSPRFIFPLVEFDAGVYYGTRYAEKIIHGSTGTDIKNALIWEEWMSF